MPSFYNVYFGDGTYARTNLEKGKYHPFWAVGISCGGMHAREEAYYFMTKKAYLQWRGVGLDLCARRPSDSPFRWIPGTYIVGLGTNTTVADNGYHSDSSMPELEFVE